MDLNKLTHKGGLPASPRGAVFENMSIPQASPAEQEVKESVPAQLPRYEESYGRPIKNVQRDKSDPEYIKGETVYLANYQWDKLKSYAKARGMRKSDVISELIKKLSL